MSIHLQSCHQNRLFGFYCSLNQQSILSHIDQRRVDVVNQTHQVHLQQLHLKNSMLVLPVQCREFNTKWNSNKKIDRFATIKNKYYDCVKNDKFDANEICGYCLNDSYSAKHAFLGCCIKSNILCDVISSNDNPI